MSQGVNFVSNSIPGSLLRDGKCQGTGRETFLSSSSNGGGGHKLFGGANVLLKTFPIHCPRTLSIRCKASNNHRRNPDFSRQQRGSSRGRNRHYQDREHSENLDETDQLSSKNGSILSLSSNQRQSATSTPGRREKEIVELFRKVQAQLRERAAIKEEKKIEASLNQGQGERGTVDSLLKLLRKHSVAQGKKSGGRDEEFNLDQTERNNSLEEEPSTNSNFLSSSNITTSDEVPKAEPVTSSRPRPTSSFRRRSPVPRVKFQPVFSAELSSLKSEDKKKVSLDEPAPEPVAFEEHGEESSDELSDNDDMNEETAEELSAVEITNLSSLKLSELREIAKSRGVKGYSKLKKADLVELLSGDGS